MWLEWLRDSKPTDWIQAVSSLAAVFVAFVSLTVSKRALNASTKTNVRPKGISFRNNFPEIELYNSGPGFAHNIRLRAHVLEGIVFDPIVPSKIWFEDILQNASGTPDMQPNQTSVFKLKKVNLFSFNHLRPIIIEHQLASGALYKSYWIYLMGQTVEDKLVQLTRFQVYVYRIHRIWLRMRDPLMTIKKKFVFRKRDSSNIEDDKIDN